MSHLASIVSSYTAYTDELVTLEATARHEYVCDRGAVAMLLILLCSLQKARATAEYLDTKLAQSRDALQASSAATSAAEESARQALSHLANLFKLLWGISTLPEAQEAMLDTQSGMSRRVTLLSSLTAEGVSTDTFLDDVVSPLLYVACCRAVLQGLMDG